VLISHDHFDHLDTRTIRQLAWTHEPLFVVPLRLKAWFRKIGILDHVIELDWWDTASIHGLQITCTPAQHYSQRSPWDLNQRLWCGWAARGAERRWLMTGDTGYVADLFRAIGSRLGPFDFAAIPIGTYSPSALMSASHVTPEEALQIANDVDASRMLAIHWGTFDLSDEPPGEPPFRLRLAAERQRLSSEQVWVLKLGETRRW
jgi:L-ascorbate metabolism protein UlaG (beta-lactamase superfamily)